MEEERRKRKRRTEEIKEDGDREGQLLVVSSEPRYSSINNKTQIFSKIDCNSFSREKKNGRRKEEEEEEIGGNQRGWRSRGTITRRVERKSPGTRPEIHACARVSRGIIFDAVCIIESRILAGRREWRLFD